MVIHSLLRALNGVVLALLLVSPVWAACTGKDLRNDLSPTERDWMTARLAEIPYPVGNHWIARKGGRTLHLIGTFHFNDPRMEQIVARLDPIIASADAVLFEVTQNDMKAFQKDLAQDMSLMLITEGPTLIDLMEPDAWDALSKRAAAAGVPSWMAAKMRPWFLGTLLGMPPCLRALKQEAKEGVDLRLAQVADLHAIPQASLEQVGDVMALFNKDPLEVQVQQLEASLMLMGGSDDMMATLLAGYFEERHAELMVYAELVFRRDTSFASEEKDRIWEDFITTFLDQRNRNWMPALLTHPGDTLVVAVGAGHLAGEVGLLNLLAQEGYTLEQAAF